VRCPNYSEYGHRGGSWKCPLTSTKKRYILNSSLFVTLQYEIDPIIIAGSEQRRPQSRLGGKKAKKGTTAEEAPTPRTRAAVAREAAAKAKREDLELELKAATAREATQAAAREEAEAAQAAAAREAAQVAARKEAEAAQAAAARDEFSTTQAHEQVMEVMALEVQLPETAIQTTTARRYCSSSTDSMIMDYLCNKSIINQTLFSTSPYLLKMHWRLKCSQLGR